MWLNDRLTLRDGVQDFGYAVRYIVAHHILDEQRSQSYTNHRANDQPPPMLTHYQIAVNHVLNEMDEQLKHIRRHGGQYAHHQAQQQHQLLLRNMLLQPLDHVGFLTND